jgi:hypothetical protein
MTSNDGAVYYPTWSTADPSAVTPSGPQPHFWAKDSASFQDLIDTINPLEHLPVVSTIYNWIVGKHDIGDVPRIAGDTLYGGPFGALSGLFNALVKEETGKDLGEHAVALVTGDKTGTSSTATAQAPAASPAQTANAPATQGPAASATPAATPASNPVPPGAVAPLPAATLTAGPSPTPQTTPAPVAAATPTPAAVLPDHAPMPLYGQPAPLAQPAGATTSPTSGGSATTQAFLSETADRERQLYRGGVPTDNGRILHPRPVPLMVPPGALPNGGQPRLQPAVATVPATVSPAAPAAVTPAAQSAAPVTTPPPNPGTPVDISQKMADALDKYMALQQQNQGRGGQVNIAP